jgi:6-pyruvoyl-tetrahydropterin synthase
MIGKKVKYNNEIYEIDVIQKNFISKTYKYKLKGLDYLLNFEDFKIIIDDIINEIDDLILNNIDQKLDTASEISETITDAINEIDIIVEKSKSKKIKK